MKIKDLTYASERGQRSYQEDRYFVSNSTYGTLLAVFDGHGGDEASQYCDEHFAGHFLTCIHNTEGNAQVALRDSFSTMAADLKSFRSGTTASLVFLPADQDIVIAAVVGDSPVVIKTTNEKIPTYWMGPDHNVRTNPAEAEAAQDRGGFLDYGYVFSSLSGKGLQMGRALGDAELGSVISNEPEIKIVTPDPTGFILVGSDGLFDPSHSDTASFSPLRTRIEAGHSAMDLVKYALNVPTQDNVTAILARLG